MTQENPQDPRLAPGPGPEPPPSSPGSRGLRVLGVVAAVVCVVLVIVGVAPVLLLGLVLALNGGQLWSSLVATRSSDPKRRGSFRARRCPSSVSTMK